MPRDIEKVRAARRRWYAKNAETQKPLAVANTRRYQARNRQITHEAKAQPCADCGVQYPFYVMQFDHVGDGDKTAHVSFLAWVPVSEAKLRAEIAKCEVVCANCHAARTWMRGQYGGIEARIEART
jgi:hypothetical protein